MTDNATENPDAAGGAPLQRSVRRVVCAAIRAAADNGDKT